MTFNPVLDWEAEYGNKCNIVSLWVSWIKIKVRITAKRIFFNTYRKKWICFLAIICMVM